MVAARPLNLPVRDDVDDIDDGLDVAPLEDLSNLRPEVRAAIELALHVASRALHVASCALHVASGALHVASGALHVASGALHVALLAMHVAPLAKHVAPLAMQVGGQCQTPIPTLTLWYLGERSA
jgi:hypothetical protein